MPFVLLVAGAVLLASAIQNTQSTILFPTLKSEFTGPNNFIFWFIAILLIGSIGYIPKAKPISTAFLTLVVLVLVLTKGNPSDAGGGFFSQFVSQIQPAQVAVTPGASAGPSLGPAIEGGKATVNDLSLPENMFNLPSISSVIH